MFALDIKKNPDYISLPWSLIFSFKYQANSLRRFSSINQYKLEEQKTINYKQKAIVFFEFDFEDFIEIEWHFKNESHNFMTTKSIVLNRLKNKINTPMCFVRLVCCTFGEGVPP